MKSNRGMGMIQLIISIIVIAIIAALGVYFLRMKYEQAKVQTAKTDMLLVEWKAKDAIEKQTVKGEEKVYIGTKVSEMKDDPLIKEFLNQNIISEEQRLIELKKIEKEIYDSGAEYICGIDEAGRGPLAGPVVIAAAIMPKDSMIEGVNDSKKVSEKKREQLYEIIINEAIAYGVGIIDQKEIDRINILNATKEGLTMAVKELTTKPDIIIVDALSKIDTCGIPYKSIIKGDAKCYSIAAASIIAKVTRDRIMRQWDEIYPQYGFAKHKGYGTAAHIQAIKEYGLCPLHRLSFVKNIVNKD